MSRLFFKSLALVITLLSISNLLADNGKPDLWKVEKAGNISYLFGSIHLGSNAMYPLSTTVNDAYLSTDNLVVEIDIKPEDEASLMSMIQKYGIDMSLPLEQRLSPETLSLFKKKCREKNLPCEQFAAYKVWLVSLQLAVMQIQQLGYKEELGIDKHFLSLAHKSNKHVISLETAESQVEIFIKFDQQQQELMLVQTLETTNDSIYDLFNSWKSGDDKTMLTLLTKYNDKPGAMEMYKVLLDDRNVKMAAQLAKNINANKSLFVVVGAGHIIGKNGIVELLKKDGFTLTQIQ